MKSFGRSLKGSGRHKYLIVVEKLTGHFGNSSRRMKENGAENRVWGAAVKYAGLTLKNLDVLLSSRVTHVAVVAAGVIFRAIQYLYNRSLWFDEAVVANKIGDYSLLELINGADASKSLAYPPGFLAAEKMMMLLFGGSEYALRFIPACLGILSVILFYFVIENILSVKARFAALCLFASSSSLILYSAEAKPYSGDIAWTLLLLLAVQKILRKDFSARAMVLLGVLGIVLPWFSYPAIFTLAGVWLTLAAMKVFERKRGELGRVIVSALWGLVSFGVNYSLIIRTFRGQTFLGEYWSKFFLPVFPVSAQNLIFHYTIFQDVFRYCLHLRFPFISSLLFLAGCREMFLRKREDFFLLMGPVGVTLLASVLHVYPFFERLILFLMPVYVIFIGGGVELLFRARPMRKIILIFLLVFVTPAFLSECFRLQDPEIYFFEESRPVVQYIKENRQEEERVFVFDQAVPPFQYYSKRMNFLQGEALPDAFLTFSRNDIKEKMRELPAGSKVWLFRTHASPDDNANILKTMNDMARCLDSFSRKGARVDLFQKIF
ncbi:MAG TPA: glycosyltransferase family 39 protein [Candidatus Omnitrophota bacterium]|mgnify:CR=1 FL=1|nr:glycosyltransferase family 39 protein [Candidatus Omnitrophota bacterium]HQO58021.1 glycosyltransferase family 39 protein [Candidatus Omnitrophota bacterium]HQP12026.1 glycosyltransferase family 39 protein [Candidatus Omnitrophota bacterium]